MQLGIETKNLKKIMMRDRVLSRIEEFEQMKLKMFAIRQFWLVCRYIKKYV